MRKTGTAEAKVYGFPLGRRGKWHPRNEGLLKRMGVDPRSTPGPAKTGLPTPSPGGVLVNQGPPTQYVVADQDSVGGDLPLGAALREKLFPLRGKSRNKPLMGASKGSTPGYLPPEMVPGSSCVQGPD
ncbi:hypothetical protein DPEC_G00331750 [Dallia pectoralis]|uniref:Uncharacterized protein n=1 Tax=Dallia pectoralis TaxID=75939 RepID=A0ACC2F614_DALPE|nr:hypothetical protein DPEC_G00331750 [Dallia pectoralis]